jgi:Phage tail assembly chaperone proteins, E, or 41 or 14
MMDGMSLADQMDAEAEAVAPRVLDLELDPPITFQKKPFATLHLEEPTGKMMERAEQELAGGVNAYALRRFQITLVAQSAKVPREVVEAMPVGQIARAWDFLETLLPGGPATGARSSQT